MVRRRKFNLTMFQFLSIGFAMVILIGSLLLMLPIASRDGKSIPFINALVTATSTTCVTGLAVYDTYTQFTMFGQVVMISLIQIGGLGFITVGLFFSMALGKRIGLKERTLLKEAISAQKIGGIVRLVRLAIFGTLSFELIGAIIMAFRFIPEYGIEEGIWFSVFHSISAFCNAGFDLIGKVAPSTSLSRYVGDPIINIPIMLLIVIGGLGYIVWDDILENKWHLRRYSLQTKIVLIVTFILLVLGTIGFYIIESNHAFANLSPFEKIWASLFQSVTPRTAGYYTVDMTTLSESGSALTMVLMFIGASPGSTGGGIKTTTFFVILFSLISYLRSKDDINVFHRKIEEPAVRRAFNSTLLYLTAAFVGVFIITLEGVGIDPAMFEVMSALSTVGLSKNLTPQLSVLSKYVVVILMYIGRVGSLSVIMSITDRRIKTKISNIEEKIAVG